MRAQALSACIVACLFIAVHGQANAITVQASVSHPAAHRVAFDAKLYESYTHAHHLRAIPYMDSNGKVTAFAAEWMKHRSLCGGAVTGIDMNPTTLSSIQQWQGCSATRRIGQTAIHFHAESWMK